MIWMVIIMTLPLTGIGLFFVLPMETALPLYLILLAVSGAHHWLMMRSMRLPGQTGPEKMVGSKAVVHDWEGQSGRVIYGGETWRAKTSSSKTFAQEDEVLICGLSGLTLFVKPVEETSQTLQSMNKTTTTRLGIIRQTTYKWTDRLRHGLALMKTCLFQ